MSFKRKHAVTGLMLAGVMAGHASLAQAEVTVIEGNPGGAGFWDPLEVQIGGSIRAQYFNEMGSQDDGSYKHNVYDGGSRLRFSADYAVNDDLTLLGYFEPGFDLMHVLRLHGQYDRDGRRTSRRQAYFGVESQRYGTLTLGKQNSVYYDVVGAKTDVWDNDMQAQAPGVGLDGDYDGSYRARRSAKYRYDVGPASLYVGALFQDEDLHVGNGIDYRRNGGGALGLDYRLTPDLVLSAAYSNTGATVHGQGSEHYRQENSGAAITWTPNQWYLSVGGGYYRNFVPYMTGDTDRFFRGDAAGVEYVAKYAIPLDTAVVKEVTPYVAGDRLEMRNGSDDHYDHQYVGVSTRLPHGFQVDLEHNFADTSDDQADATLARVRYDF
ncbi:hypothetical protein FP66_04970 [Halomonas salina]|uniref:Porin n=2 Tax=Halomonas salina TaxID=42565 RepID=A0ABR4WTZ3_9GAMM|nr:hypothetical protein FP66_04970 [Halomonas salina]